LVNRVEVMNLVVKDEVGWETTKVKPQDVPACHVWLYRGDRRWSEGLTVVFRADAQAVRDFRDWIRNGQALKREFQFDEDTGLMTHLPHSTELFYIGADVDIFPEDTKSTLIRSTESTIIEPTTQTGAKEAQERMTTYDPETQETAPTEEAPATTATSQEAKKAARKDELLAAFPQDTTIKFTRTEFAGQQGMILGVKEVPPYGQQYLQVRVTHYKNGTERPTDKQKEVLSLPTSLEHFTPTAPTEQVMSDGAQEAPEATES
jgi:hypothetical protein